MRRGGVVPGRVALRRVVSCSLSLSTHSSLSRSGYQASPAYHSPTKRPDTTCGPQKAPPPHPAKFSTSPRNQSSVQRPNNLDRPIDSPRTPISSPWQVTSMRSEQGHVCFAQYLFELCSLWQLPALQLPLALACPAMDRQGQPTPGSREIESWPCLAKCTSVPVRWATLAFFTGFVDARC